MDDWTTAVYVRELVHQAEAAQLAAHEFNASLKSPGEKEPLVLSRPFSHCSPPQPWCPRCCGRSPATSDWRMTWPIQGLFDAIADVSNRAQGWLTEHGQ